jgi:hypothetical protein
MALEISLSMVGTWRDGYKEIFAEALRFEKWEDLWDWAESGANVMIVNFRFGRSTDLCGGRHTYIDTRAGGKRDGCRVILEEMRFIGLHNIGDVEFFMRLIKGWIKMQDLDKHIPH